jgi:O-antigen ligase
MRARGAWLGLAVALLFLGYVLGARREILVVAAIATLLVIFVAPLRARFNSVFNVRGDTAMTERIQVMRDALHIGFAHPVLGVGYGRGRLKVAIRNSAGSETPANKPIWHAHNLYLELLAGTGFVGLGAYLWLLGRALSCTFHAARLAVGDDKVLTLGIVASAVALIVCGLSDVTFHHHETRLFCFSLLALMLLAHPDRGGVGGPPAL